MALRHEELKFPKGEAQQFSEISNFRFQIPTPGLRGANQWEHINAKHIASRHENQKLKKGKIR
jgi:hypothetical protein